MSAKELLGGELPSDSESDDSDYVTENDASSSSSEEEEMVEESRRDKKSYKREIQRVRAHKIFQELMEKEEAKVRSEDHSDVLQDPLMLAFQRRQPKPVKQPVTIDAVMTELRKYSSSSRGGAEPMDTMKYKNEARASLRAHQVNREDVARALAGISGSKIEVQEEVRYAGQLIKLSKTVEKTSSHAARFERRKRAAEEQATLGGGGLGSFQQYLNEIKSHRAVTSVEKSATDWNQLKMSTAGMEEALKVDRGYLDRQAFLARSGAAEDELRREARRKKLMEMPPNSSVP